MTAKRGPFVVAMTGINGAGKTTVARSACAMIRGRGGSCIVRKLSIFGNPAYRHFRATIDALSGVDRGFRDRALLALITLETLRFANEEVQSAADRDQLVLCERYVESAICFLLAQGLIDQWDGGPLSTVPPADVTIHLSIPPELALVRREAMGERVSHEEVAFMRRMDGVLFEASSQRKWQTVDATRTPEAVVADVLDIVTQAYWM